VEPTASKEAVGLGFEAMATCPACGATNREGARFCDGCGSVLATSSSSASRRVVTVLFSDITGSTELGERLDAERMRQVLTRYFDTMRSVIERHGARSRSSSVTR
jgi:class 3 adenylate cyclase